MESVCLNVLNVSNETEICNRLVCKSDLNCIHHHRTAQHGINQYPKHHVIHHHHDIHDIKEQHCHKHTKEQQSFNPHMLCFAIHIVFVVLMMETDQPRVDEQG